MLTNRNSQVVTPLHSKGRDSRAAILLAAVKLSAVHGLRGMSIGDLAAKVGMSKSGIYAHFKTKQALELATVETAAAILDKEVLRPAMKARRGRRRLDVLVDAFLSYLERKVFPRGCFIAAIALEMEERSSPACNVIIAALEQWNALLRQCILDAREQGEIDPLVNVVQTAFEIQAMLYAANFFFVTTNDPIQLRQSKLGVQNILAKITTPSHTLPAQKPKQRAAQAS